MRDAVERSGEKNPWAAAALSVVPGAGHAYAGHFKKCLVFFCMDAGLSTGFFFSHSFLLRLTLASVYLATAVPAAIDAYFLVKTGASLPQIDSKGYVVLMLVFTGFSALPLLWQSRNFSRTGKIFWTVAVPLLAVFYFGSLVLWGPRLQSWFTGGKT